MAAAEIIDSICLWSTPRSENARGDQRRSMAGSISAGVLREGVDISVLLALGQ